MQQQAWPGQQVCLETSTTSVAAEVAIALVLVGLWQLYSDFKFNGVCDLLVFWVSAYVNRPKLD